jgi:DNA-binding CsgD family transcriptional regulator
VAADDRKRGEADAEPVQREIRSGDAVFAFGDDLTIVAWNEATEKLTGIPAGEAVGRPCWEVLAGVDVDGGLICNAGCSGARLAREGWPVAARELSIRTRAGRRKVLLSTIALRDGESSLYFHLLRNGGEVADNFKRDADPKVETTLTPRQREVLKLLADGAAAKVVAQRLGISETTVRNHIRSILLELGCHSQLEAVAEARRRGLLS